MWNVDFKIGKSDNCAGGINMLVICNSYLCLYYKFVNCRNEMSLSLSKWIISELSLSLKNDVFSNFEDDWL